MKGLLIVLGLILGLGGVGGIECNDQIGQSVLITIAGLSMMFAGIILMNKEGK